MGWFSSAARGFDKDVEAIAEICLRLRPFHEKPFNECVKAIRQWGLEESYHRENSSYSEYGFFVSERKFSGHVSSRAPKLSFEGHENYYGVIISLTRDNVSVDLSDALRNLGKLGKNALKLQSALLRREGFSSLEKLQKELFGGT